MLPTEWLGEHIAELVANAVDSVLDDVAADQGHELRLGFNRAVDRLIELKHDPEMAAHAEEIKLWLKRTPRSTVISTSCGTICAPG